jgi:hypothetical protein
MSNDATVAIASRRPRFRRASDSPGFRVTEDDIAIIRHISRHRFLRSNHIAVLAGRSIDRTNDRLCHLYHAAYIDRPQAQGAATPRIASFDTLSVFTRSGRSGCSFNNLARIGRLRYARQLRQFLE